MGLTHGCVVCWRLAGQACWSWLGSFTYLGLLLGRLSLALLHVAPQACSPGRGSRIGEKVEAHKAFQRHRFGSDTWALGCHLISQSKLQGWPDSLEGGWGGGRRQTTSSLWEELTHDFAKGMYRGVERWSYFYNQSILIATCVSSRECGSLLLTCNRFSYIRCFSAGQSSLLYQFIFHWFL